MRFRSRAVSNSFHLTLLERRGMTLHLLKHSAKPSKQREYRKKYPALEFRDFHENNKEEEKEEAPDKEMNDSSYRDVTYTLKKSKRNKTSKDPN